MKFNRSLVLLILAGLLPVAVLAAAMGAGALRQQQEAMQSEALARVSLVATVLDRELTAQIDLVEAVAASTLLDPPMQATAFAEFADRVRRSQPLWYSVVLSDPTGERQVVVTDLAISRSGQVVDPESHAEVVRTAKPVIGQVRRGANGRAAFAIRAPVIRGGRVIQVVSAVIEPRTVRDLLFGVGLSSQWLAAIVDAEGRFVARTSGAEQLIGSPASTYVREANARARDGGPTEGVYEGVTLEGVRNVSVYRYLPDWGWSVHLAIPWDVYQAPIRNSLWLLGGSAALGLAMAALFAWLLWRELSLRRREEAAIEDTRRMEALGRMTGGVAHDFNNLLMIVQGSAELLKRRKDPARIDTFTDAILTAAQRGQALTRQLLAFARRSSHEPVTFELKDRAAEIQALLDRSTRGNVETVLLSADGVWPMRADPNALEIALINLAINARDAMPEGGRITVSAANVAFKARDPETGLAGEFVALSVQDTGVGIPPEHMAHIFEPFYTTKPSGKGTGLGLSQVYGFAKQSGGTVTVQSRPGAGATFTLYLPRSSEPTASPAAPRAARSDADEGRLLLVEDNQEVGEVVEEMLTAAGYTVTRISNAAAALETIDRGEGFDVVLSDIVLESGMSGLELAREIKARRPGLPIVLMTGYSEALASGAGQGLPILAKPFSERDALAALRAARGEAKERPAAE